MSQLPSTANVWLDVHSGLGISLMDHLFNRMDGAYPGKWKSQFPNQTSIQNWRDAWAEKFIEKNITPAEIRKAISASTDLYDWPPSLPEFIKACKPQISPESAFHEAVKQLIKRKEGKDVWSSKAVYWAAQSIGDFDMNQPWQSIKCRWTKEFNDMMAEESLPNIPAYAVALPPPGKTTLDPEEGKKRVAEAVKQINAPTDHKAWARKLIEQEASGAAKPHPVALAGASEALGAQV